MEKRRKKNHMLRKDFFMEIKHNKSRFLSILAIVTLGVAFFAGVRASGPDMQLSADAFYDAENLMDIRVLGTLGMTDADVKALKQTEGVQQVSPSYSADLLCDGHDSQYVMKVMSLTEHVNQVTVTSGRLPEKSGEILLDTQMKKKYGYQLGETITMRSGDETSLDEVVKQKEFQVVGFGDSPFYLSLERGVSTVGDGKVDGFAVIREEDFSMEAYSELYVLTERGKDLLCYSDAYTDDTETVMNRIEELEKERCQIRYDEVQAEGQKEIQKGKNKITDAKKQLSDAETKLHEAEKKLKDGEKELADGEQQLEDAKMQIADGQAQLRDGQERLEENRKTLEEGQRQLEEGYQQLEGAAETYQQSVAEYETAKAEYENGMAELSRQEDLLLQQEQMLLTAPDTAEAQMQLEESQRQAAEARAQLEAEKERLAEGEEQLISGKAQLDAAKQEMEANQNLLREKEQELQRGREELAAGEQQLEENRKTLEDSRQQMEEAQQELKKGRAELKNHKKELADAKKTFQKEKEEAERKIADASKDIAEGEQELADMEKPQWYVLDRNSIQTYVEYDQDSQRIVAIGNVFPVIFFLVAALVCLTTMTRMVEEGRTQIGILKALGYRKGAIAAKYMMYALLATAMGSAVGIVAGQLLLPKVIIKAYAILYTTLPKALTPIHGSYAATSAIPAVLCTTLAALAACQSELRSVPAQLMRPEAPKTGKRILLERADFIWKRLSFTGKSTMRNLFRYKKRFWMTVLGIGGCMGLLLVGFGLRDSIMAIGDKQFGQIRTFSGSITLEDDLEKTQAENVFEKIAKDSDIREVMRARETSIDVQSKEGKEKSAYQVVIQDTERMEKFLVLQDRISKKPQKLDTDGVIVTEKLAKLLKIKPGDSIYLKDGDTKRVKTTVTAVVENYFYHYVYMTADLYQKLYDTDAVIHDVFFIMDSEKTQIQERIRKEYMELPGVSNVSFCKETKDRVADMIKSMDSVIYVIVISAGMLAFVVLYNLNHINICERRRELATLKVLGFYNREVSAYVLRENIWLTLFGCILGVVFGIVLHRYVILTAEIDLMMFGREIRPRSFFISILLTWVFSALVNIAMYFRLKRINMVESLKSIE